MVEKKSAGEKVFDCFNVLFMILLVFITLYPLYYVLLCSLSDSGQLIGNRGLMLVPKGFSLAGYMSVFSNPNLLSGYRTTLIVVIFGTALDVFLTSIGAFLVTRKKFAIKRAM